MLAHHALARGDRSLTIFYLAASLFIDRNNVAPLGYFGKRPGRRFLAACAFAFDLAIPSAVARLSSNA